MDLVQALCKTRRLVTEMKLALSRGKQADYSARSETVARRDGRMTV